MDITLSALKTNPAKYFEMARIADIFVTRRGKRVGRIVSEEKPSKSERAKAIEALLSAGSLPPEYSDDSYDPDYEIAREAAYREMGLL